MIRSANSTALFSHVFFSQSALVISGINSERCASLASLAWLGLVEVCCVMFGAHSSQHSMGFFKKLKFWRRRDDFFQGRVEELKKKLEEAHAIQEQLTKLEETSKERDRERENLEAILPDQTMETDREVTHAETIKKLAKKLQRSEAERKHVETALRGQIEETGNKLIEKEQFEANLRGHIKELEKKLQERDADMEKLGTALRGQIQELEYMVREREKYIIEMKVSFRETIRELREKLKQTDKLKKKTKKDLKIKEMKLEKKTTEVTKLRKCIEKAVIDKEELQSTIWLPREEFCHRCKELRYLGAKLQVDLRAVHYERDMAISRVKELQKQIREKRPRQEKCGNQPPLQD